MVPIGLSDGSLYWLPRRVELRDFPELRAGARLAEPLLLRAGARETFPPRLLDGVLRVLLLGFERVGVLRVVLRGVVPRVRDVLPLGVEPRVVERVGVLRVVLRGVVPRVRDVLPLGVEPRVVERVGVLRVVLRGVVPRVRDVLPLGVEPRVVERVGVLRVVLRGVVPRVRDVLPLGVTPRVVERTGVLRVRPPASPRVTERRGCVVPSTVRDTPRLTVRPGALSVGSCPR